MINLQNGSEKNMPEWKTMEGVLESCREAARMKGVNEGQCSVLTSADLYDDKAIFKDANYTVNYSRMVGYLRIRGLEEKLMTVFDKWSNDDVVKCEIIIALARLGSESLDAFEGGSGLENADIASLYEKAIDMEFSDDVRGILEEHKGKLEDRVEQG